MVNELAFEKEPLPSEVHKILDWFEAVAPEVIFTEPAPAQVLTAFPAFALGVALIVIVLVETASEQEAFPIAVKVKVLLPALISAGLGVYVHNVNEFAFENVPVPFDVHTMLT